MIKLQKQVDELIELLHEAQETIGLSEIVLDAYLYRSRVRCGRESCKCMVSDYRHECHCLSFMEGGASRTRTVHESELAELGKLTADYKRLRKLRKELLAQHRRLLDSFDREVARQLEKGRKRLVVLLANKRCKND